MDNVEFEMTSSLNISFRHRVDSGCSPEEWADLTDDERTEVMAEALWEAVDIVVVQP